MSRHDQDSVAPCLPSPASSTALTDGPPISLASPKLQAHHLDRGAIIYVRQSSPQQVRDHQESGRRQYALVDRAVALGWPKDCVEVVDEDQAISGKTAEARLGFQRLLTEVSLDHVGIILGIEMSRLARSGKDWHQLIEVCAIFQTLLGDQDGLYDPNDHNDRLLLGLSGIMSEAELHILKNRMYQGLLNKARRGEVYNHPPNGYIKLPGSGLDFDPDEQVQSVVRLIFDQFERLGTVHGLLRYLVHHDIRIGIRPHFGPNRGNLEWRRANRVTLQNMLHHPVYAGYYRWGHRPIDPRRQVPGRPATGRTVCRPEDSQVLIPDHCPAYISAERFWSNQERLQANRARAESLGAPREGPSLLAGLVVCGRCDRQMMVSYNNNGKQLRYSCNRAAIDYAEPLCQSLAGEVLDEMVTQQVLGALAPASLELSLQAAGDLQRQRDLLRKQWQQRLERARYACDRAERQYQATEPENRLVARELERRWEETLREHQALQEEYHRFDAKQAARLSDEERGQIMSLADDIPALWNASTTASQDRQRIVRALVEEVVVNVQGESERVDVTLRWAGGFASHHELVRPVNRYEQLTYYPELIGRLKELYRAGLSRRQIADKLNAEGFHPPKRADSFTSAMVTCLLVDQQLVFSSESSTRAFLAEDEWWPVDLCAKLGMPLATMHRWIKVGWVHARKLAKPRPRWAIWADKDELDRLSRLRSCSRSWENKPLYSELIAPKPRPET